MDTCPSSCPLPDPAPGEVVVVNLCYSLWEAAQGLGAGKWCGMSYSGGCERMDLRWIRQKQKPWDFVSGRVKRWKEVERAKERPPPRKGVQIRVFQMVESEPERRNVRKAQGRGDCIQYGLNHLGMERKVHMPNKSLWKNLGHSFLHHLVRWNEELPTMFQLFKCFQLSSLGNLNSFNLLLKVLFSFSSIIFIALSGNLPTVSTSCISCQTQSWRGF